MQYFSRFFLAAATLCAVLSVPTFVFAVKYDFSYPSIASAFFDDFSTISPIGLGGVIVKDEDEAFPQADSTGKVRVDGSRILGISRMYSPLTIFSAVDLKKVFSLRDKYFASEKRYVCSVLPPDTKFLAGSFGALIRQSLLSNVRMVLTPEGEGACVVNCDEEFLSLLRTFNRNLVSKIQTEFITSYAREHGFAPRELHLDSPHDNCAYKAALKPCDQAEVRALFVRAFDETRFYEMLGHFCSGAQYNMFTEPLPGGATDTLLFRVEEESSARLLDDLFSEENSRLILGRLFAFYIFYAWCCTDRFVFDIEPEQNVVLEMLDNNICRFAMVILERGAEWDWVKRAVTTSLTVLPEPACVDENQKKAAAAA